MKKIFYYLRLITFLVYLVLMFLLIDKLYKPDFLIITFFVLNIIYAIFLILTILSKKNIFKTTISYNILNIGLYAYTTIIYIIVFDTTKLEIMNNQTYFNTNFIMLSILILSLILYTLLLNNESS